MDAPTDDVPVDNFLILEINQIQTEEQLDDVANKLIARFQTYAGINKTFGGLRISKAKKKGPNAQTKKPRIDRNNKNVIQGLYRNQQHRAVQEILFGPTFDCYIEDAKIEKHWHSVFGVKSECNISELPPFLWQNSTPTENYNVYLEKKFSSKEVRDKLQQKYRSRLSNSRSVGLDRIKYRTLLKYDPKSLILTAFFNACIQLQKVPKVWKLPYSVLIQENKGDDDNIKSWYLITMHSTMSKLFQSLIAARLISWSLNTGRLSATQKGFLLNNAACESSFILQECKNYAQKCKKDLVVAWLDFSKASDSVPQEAILHALQRHGVPTSIRNIIESTLDGAQTKIRTVNEAGFTNPITILKGLPQGAPLNPILLDLVMEPILRNLASESSNMFQIFNKKINHFAIPNELTLIAESMTNLQNLLNIVEKTAKSIGLQFNVHKCSTYHYDSKKNETQKTSFKFYGQDLNILPEKEIDRYFGVKQGLSIGQSGIPTVEEMIESIEGIGSSKLDCFQKIDAVLTFIIPRVENCLRGLQNIKKTPLDEADKTLRDKLKEWLSLPKDCGIDSVVFQASAEMLRMKTKYLPFLDLLYVMKVVQALKMFNSKDEIVQCIAFESITKEVSEVVTKQLKDGITKKTLASYLSGDLPIKNTESNSMWFMVREATLQLKIKIDLSWEYKDKRMLITVKDNIKMKRNINMSQFEEDLKNCLISYYINEVKKRNPEADAVVNPKMTSSTPKSHKKGSKAERQLKFQKLNAAPVQPIIPITMLMSNFPLLNAVR
ncbi:hypothetical protein TSAR_010254 [Trichomalopsis sarcophagae]|uniref:Reverse transcriptase domain-containing protein n=1 Tax=Trichomalopsis sarcophagae TaxID=543379 RepID=A0A232FLQ5_9HYME|nr:hypothetical protein TSAR_010254 [Trichomalopsis sarcophagae]